MAVVTCAVLAVCACDDDSETTENDTGSPDLFITEGGVSDGPPVGDAAPDGLPADASAMDGASADAGSPDAGGEGCFELADGRCVQETFVNPPRLAPNADGVYELEMVPTEFSFAGQRHCVRAYNNNYVAPTIETAAREGDAPRQVRVNYRNRFGRTDFRSVDNGVCECHDHETGESCEPESHGPEQDCHCFDENDEPCHTFDFNVTNLHASGSLCSPRRRSDSSPSRRTSLATRTTSRSTRSASSATRRKSSRRCSTA
jgi:hypothetical protein